MKLLVISLLPIQVAETSSLGMHFGITLEGLAEKEKEKKEIGCLVNFSDVTCSQ